MKTRLLVILALFAIVLTYLVINKFNPYFNMAAIMGATIIAMVSASYVLDKHEKLNS